MKRKFAMMVLVATMAASMMTGCGAKSDNSGAAQQEATTHIGVSGRKERRVKALDITQISVQTPIN